MRKRKYNIRFKAGISLTELQKKVRSRKYFCSLVEYGMKENELVSLGGYTRGKNVRNRIKKCNKLNRKG